MPTKPSLRICHLSDIHLGYRRYNRLTKTGFNQREQDVNTAFRETIDRVLALKPDIVLIAGDLFHTVRPSNAIITFCFRELRRFSESTRAPLIVVAGNHESPKRSDSGSLLKLLAEIPRVYVADSSMERFNFPEISLSVLCLPHPSLTHLEGVSHKADDRFSFNVLVTHAQIDSEIFSDFGGVFLDLKRLSPNEWDYIALGHVHMYKTIGLNAAYSGSIEHTGTNIWFEGFHNKGFLIVELPSGKKTFHSLTSPREVIILEAINAQGLEADAISSQIIQRLEAIAGGIEGKIVRLEIKNIPREVTRLLNHREFKNFRAKALHLSLEFKPPDIVALASSNTFLRGSLQDELDKFYEAWKNSQNNKEDILGVIKEYLKKLEEKDEVIGIVA